jgi:hypothetical protein
MSYVLIGLASVLRAPWLRMPGLLSESTFLALNGLGIVGLGRVWSLTTLSKFICF